jgi:hypothetical protein
VRFARVTGSPAVGSGIERHVKVEDQSERPSNDRELSCAWCNLPFVGILELLTHVEDCHLPATDAA